MRVSVGIVFPAAYHRVRRFYSLQKLLGSRISASMVSHMIDIGRKVKICIQHILFRRFSCVTGKKEFIVSVFHKQGHGGIIRVVVFIAGRQNRERCHSQIIFRSHKGCPCFQPLMIQRLYQLLIGFRVFFKVRYKHFINIKLCYDNRGTADMICIGMSEDQIIQLLDLALLEVILNCSSFGIIPSVDQHGMISTGDQRCISLSHVKKMHFHDTRIHSLSRNRIKPKASHGYHSRKQQAEKPLMYLFHMLFSLKMNDDFCLSRKNYTKKRP